MALVKFGGMGAAGFPDPLKTPWWWAYIVQIWTKIGGIVEAGLYDVDKECAPKEIWLNEKELEAWYRDRERIRKERSEQQVY